MTSKGHLHMKWRSPFVVKDVIVLATSDVDLTWLQMERAQLFAKAEAASMCGMNWDNQDRAGQARGQKGQGREWASWVFPFEVLETNLQRASSKIDTAAFFLPCIELRPFADA